MNMKKSKFELLAAKTGGWTFRLKSPNGVVMLTGRTYKTKSEALHAITSTIRYGQTKVAFVLRQGASGKFFFQLKSPSGRLLGWSNYYESAREREIAVNSVILAVTTGRIFDGN